MHRLLIEWILCLDVDAISFCTIIQIYYRTPVIPKEIEGSIKRMQIVNIYLVIEVFLIMAFPPVKLILNYLKKQA